MALDPVDIVLVHSGSLVVRDYLGAFPICRVHDRGFSVRFVPSDPGLLFGSRFLL